MQIEVCGPPSLPWTLLPSSRCSHRPSRRVAWIAATALCASAITAQAQRALLKAHALGGFARSPGSSRLRRRRRPRPRSCFPPVLQMIAQDKWKPAVKIVQVLEGLRDLIHSPEPDHPLRAEIAEEFVKDRAAFNKVCSLESPPKGRPRLSNAPLSSKA